jgi:hypothetical protein
MFAFKVRFRYPAGSWGETIIMARNNFEATQQAYAIYGQANVLGVWQDNY